MTKYKTVKKGYIREGDDWRLAFPRVLHDINNVTDKWTPVPPQFASQPIRAYPQYKFRRTQ